MRSTTPRRELGMGRTFAAAANVALERGLTVEELRGTRETSKEMRRGECTCVSPLLGERVGLWVRGEDEDITCISDTIGMYALSMGPMLCCCSGIALYSR